MQAENPLEHIVQHPLIERPAHLGPLTPDGVVTVFSDQIAMLLLAALDLAGLAAPSGRMLMLLCAPVAAGLTVAARATPEPSRIPR